MTDYYIFYHRGFTVFSFSNISPLLARANLTLFARFKSRAFLNIVKNAVADEKRSLKIFVSIRYSCVAAWIWFLIWSFESFTSWTSVVRCFSEKNRYSSGKICVLSFCLLTISETISKLCDLYQQVSLVSIPAKFSFVY